MGWVKLHLINELNQRCINWYCYVCSLTCLIFACTQPLLLYYLLPSLSISK